MQVPKRKTSKSRRNMRRAHHALSARLLVRCTECKELKLRHVVCPHCGHYRNRKITQAAAE